MTGNPQSDTLRSGSHIQKRLHERSCSSWKEKLKGGQEGDHSRLGGEGLEAEPVTL